MRPSRLLRSVGLAAGLILALAGPLPAWAGQVEAAEHVRLSEEMRKLAARNLWSGVEEQFKSLEALTTEGETLTVNELELGSQAARHLGDVTSARSRLERAARAGGSPSVIQALEQIDGIYGAATVNVDPKYTGDRLLIPAEPPFDPDQQQAIAWANRALATGSYDGLLPFGAYTVGGKNLTVAKGAAAQPVALMPDLNAPKEPYKLAWAGPRLSVGVAYSVAGEPTADDVEAGPQAVGFSGPGARAGLGLDVGLTPHVGVLAEVGYHGLYAPGAGVAMTAEGVTVPQQVAVTSGNTLHMGYGWLAASLRFGNLWLAAGPVMGLASATVNGVTGPCVTGESAGCVDYPALTSANAAGQRVSGRITASGGAASVSYGVVDIASLRGAISVEGGAQSDSYRLYPWGELAFTLAPGVRRN